MALLQTWNVVTGNALGSSLCQKLNSQWAMMQDDKKHPDGTTLLPWTSSTVWFGRSWGMDGVNPDNMQTLYKTLM